VKAGLEGVGSWIHALGVIASADLLSERPSAKRLGPNLRNAAVRRSSALGPRRLALSTQRKGFAAK